MLLATSRICARPVTFKSNFDKYNGRERPEGDIKTLIFTLRALVE